MKVICAFSVAFVVACAPRGAPELALDVQPIVATRGQTGCTSPWVATVRNGGVRAAPALVVLQSLSGEPYGTPLRIAPGPAAGEALTVALCRPHAEFGPWCVRVQLQQLHAADPLDQQPGNDRWCLQATDWPLMTPDSGITRSLE